MALAQLCSWEKAIVCTSAMLGCKGLTLEVLSFIFADIKEVPLFFVMVRRLRRIHMPGDSFSDSHC